MVSMLLLFASAVADPAVTGAAALAVLCGVVLLGGRSVIGFPLRLVRSLKPSVRDSEQILLDLRSQGDREQAPVRERAAESRKQRLVASRTRRLLRIDRYNEIF